MGLIVCTTRSAISFRMRKVVYCFCFVPLLFRIFKIDLIIYICEFQCVAVDALSHLSALIMLLSLIDILHDITLSEALATTFFLVLQLSRLGIEKRAGCVTFVVFWIPCGCFHSLPLPHSSQGCKLICSV